MWRTFTNLRNRSTIDIIRITIYSAISSRRNTTSYRCSPVGSWNNLHFISYSFIFFLCVLFFGLVSSGSTFYVSYYVCASHFSSKGIVYKYCLQIVRINYLQIIIAGGRDIMRSLKFIQIHNLYILKAKTI